MSDLIKEPFSSDNKKHKNHSKYQHFIPKDSFVKKSVSDGNKRITADEVFISNKAFTMFSSIFSREEDKLPQYMAPYRDIIAHVTNFSEEEMDEINKIQMEKEHLHREKEQIEAKKEAEKEAYELQIKSSLDKKVDMIMHKHKYFVKRMCPVKIPHKSTLNHQEHEFYLRSFIKFQIRPFQTKHEEQEYNQYISLQNKVFNEQYKLMDFAQKVSQLVLNEYNTVPSTIENYIKSRVNHRCKRILAYPQYFRTEMNIPIKPQDQGFSFNLKYLGHLLSLGSVPAINVPNSYKSNILPMDESVEKKRRPDMDMLFDQNTVLYKCPISKDPNAEFLAQEHNVNIVMSASAFKTIADNQEQPFDNYWNIPVTIKSYKVKDEQGKEKSLRVVYIDKPLPKVSWHPLEMKASFFKQSALGHLTYPNSHPNNKMKVPVLSSWTPESRGVKNIYDDDIFETTKDEGFDYFESGFSSPSFSKKNNSPFRKRKSSPPSYPYYHSPNSLTSEVVLKGGLEEDLFLTDDDDEEEDSKHSQKFNEKKSSNKKISDKTKTDVLFNNQFNSSKDFQNKAESFKMPNFIEKPISHQAGPSHNRNLKKADGNSQSEMSESSGLLDNLLNTQKNFLTLKSENHVNYKRSPSSATSSIIQLEEQGGQPKGNFNKNALKKPWSQTMHTDWGKCKNLKECPHAKNNTTNVHYQLYQFENVKSTPTKETSDPLKIIVRHNIHGLSKPMFEKKKKFKSQRPTTKAYVVYPKLENQVYFGAEINSYSEITQQWASLAVRPNTTLLQVRVCVASGSIVLTEERTLETVLKEGNQAHIKFHPQAPLATLNALFRCLTKLSSGQYMIHHSSKTEAFISIMKELDSNGGVSHNFIDTHSIYANGSVIIRHYTSSPWLNIDTHVLTPFHLVHKKVPATFPMNNPNVKLSKKVRKKKRQAADKKKNIDEVADSKNEQEPKRKEREECQEKKSKRRYF